MTSNELRCAAQQKARQALPSARTQDDQIGTPMRSRLQDRFANVALVDRGIRTNCAILTSEINSIPIALNYTVYMTLTV